MKFSHAITSVWGKLGKEGREDGWGGGVELISESSLRTRLKSKSQRSVFSVREERGGWVVQDEFAGTGIPSESSSMLTSISPELNLYAKSDFLFSSCFR